MKTQIKVNDLWVDGAPSEGEWCNIEVMPGVWEQKRFFEPLLSDAKSARITLIKQEAGARIKALDWMVTRASEQPELYSMDEAKSKRQQVRADSDVAELAVDALATSEEIKQFTW